MKTIEVTNEMYKSLMVLSKDLNKQSHRGTRMPYILQVSRKKEVSAYEGCGETFWFDSEGGKLETEEEENELIKEYLFEKYGESHVFDINMEDWERFEILEVLECRNLEVTEEDELSEFFFTEKALRNKYGNEVNTFLTASNNLELKTVMKFLCELSGGKLHL